MYEIIGKTLTNSQETHHKNKFRSVSFNNSSNFKILNFHTKVIIFICNVLNVINPTRSKRKLRVTCAGCLGKNQRSKKNARFVFDKCIAFFKSYRTKIIVYDVTLPVLRC